MTWLYAVEAWLLLNALIFWWLADGRYRKRRRPESSEVHQLR